MFKPADKTNLVEGLRQSMTPFLTKSPSELTRPELGAELDFGPLLPLLEEIVDVTTRISRATLDVLPYYLLSALATAYAQLTSRYQHLEGFSAARSDNPLIQRNRLLGDFDTEARTFFQNLSPLLPTVLVLATGALTEVEPAVGRVKTMQGEIQASKIEIDGLLRAAKEATAKVGIAQHAAHFANQAREHRHGAYLWLAATCLAAAITIAASLYNYQLVRTALVPQLGGDAITSLTPSTLVQYALAKLIVFSILLSATLWCAKVYRAQKHNYVVNRHRQNALSSFEAFAASATDEQTKSAVLLQATQSIFTPQPTGYIAEDSEAGSSSHIVELIRSAGTSGR